ncbi:AMP-binding protein [Kocuria sp. CPCC 205297]|uniref:AMP-binding protein n=1 Tax=Kocuria sp. CPCC 205297 TaxID=3073558 RepID=UPI0034D4E498
MRQVERTRILWVAADLGGSAPVSGIAELNVPGMPGVDRPLWGVATSGTTSSPKIALGYSDEWEDIVRLQAKGIYDPAFPSGEYGFATHLPIQFSAAFFMLVLPAMLLRRDLTVTTPVDWAPVLAAQDRAELFFLSAPSVMAAACSSETSSPQLHRTVVVLGGGHLGRGRVQMIREHTGAKRVWNIYGTAETGCLSIDEDPGHGTHVGRPIPGKKIWAHGDGQDSRIAAEGADCCAFLWTPGTEVTAVDLPVSADLGRLDPHGHIVLEGRVDGTVKLRGRLVDLRSIERHLLRLEGVHDVSVRVVERADGLDGLAARVVGTVTSKNIWAHGTGTDGVVLNEIECLAERDAAHLYSDNGKLQRKA